MATITECCDETERLEEIRGTDAPTAVIRQPSLPSEPPDGNSSSSVVAALGETETSGMDSNAFTLPFCISFAPPDSGALTTMVVPDEVSTQTGGRALPRDHEEATFETSEDQCNVLINSVVYTLSSMESGIATETYVSSVVFPNAIQAVGV